jgi:predicted ArsR family transcriptional regulator
MSDRHNNANRAKLVALIVALQLEPTRVEDLATLSGMHSNAVGEWLKALEAASLVGYQEMPTRGHPRMWAWRFA